MGLRYSQWLFILVAASILAVGLAHRPYRNGSDPWGHGFNDTSYSSPHKNVSWHFDQSNYTNNWPYKNNDSTYQHTKPKGPRQIVVGGSDKWRFGFNYTDWATKNGPFYMYDTLVFKYEAPSKTKPFAHSVYILPDIWSFMKCDMRRAKRVANVNQGGGRGFKFTLKRWQPYYFVCGEHNGTHCDMGMMKFVVVPFFRPYQT